MNRDLYEVGLAIVKGTPRWRKLLWALGLGVNPPMQLSLVHQPASRERGPCCAARFFLLHPIKHSCPSKSYINYQIINEVSLVLYQYIRKYVCMYVYMYVCQKMSTGPGWSKCITKSSQNLIGPGWWKYSKNSTGPGWSKLSQNLHKIW